MPTPITPYSGEVPNPFTQAQPQFDANVQDLVDFITELPDEINQFAEDLGTANTNSTSVTSNTVGTGSKAFTVQTALSYFPGQSLTIARTAAPTNRMFAVVDSYNSGTGALVVTSQAFEGSGTFTDWTITLGFNGLITPDQVPDGSISAIKTGIVGELFDWPFADTPSHGLLCNGATVSSATYSNLFAKSVKHSTVTMTIASPCVVSWVGHGLYANAPIKFTTTGALPTGITAGTTYYVIAAGLTADAFRISATIGGAAINTTGSQSGIHTGIHAVHGCANDLTTFNLPNIPEDYTTVQANANEGTSTVGEVISHNHAMTLAARGSSGSNAAVGAGAGTLTDSTGGAANLAAGVRVRKCIRY